MFWSTANRVEPHDPSKMCPRPLQCINGKIALLQPTPHINDSSQRVNVTKTMSTAHSTHLRPLNAFTTGPTHIINTNDILTGPYTLLQPTPCVNDTSQCQRPQTHLNDPPRRVLNLNNAFTTTTRVDDPPRHVLNLNNAFSNTTTHVWTSKRVVDMSSPIFRPKHEFLARQHPFLTRFLCETCRDVLERTCPDVLEQIIEC